jgi:ComF family protein
MITNLIHRLWPGHCVVCGGPSADGADLCRPCHRELPWLERPCPRCGLPLPEPAGPAAPCGACLRQPPPFSACHAPFLYQPPVSRLIASFKYRDRYSYGRALAIELARRVDAGAVDALLPVPLHWRRRWTRGFNQAEVIADQLGRMLTLPVHARWLRRRRSTPPQQGLDAQARALNLRGAFALDHAPTGLRVALVDDVVTTGATAAELSRLLLAAGAATVQVWCLARTPR